MVDFSGGLGLGFGGGGEMYFDGKKVNFVHVVISRRHDIYIFGNLAGDFFFFWLDSTSLIN